MRLQTFYIIVFAAVAAVSVDVDDLNQARKIESDIYPPAWKRGDYPPSWKRGDYPPSWKRDEPQVARAIPPQARAVGMEVV
ncbi:hypothetical protein B0H12DRAFT_1232927 [Mycena haematopus]|nr:hypothetical protein B0H12DRAFT_1232927 [Mycena haematopus]